VNSNRVIKERCLGGQGKFSNENGKNNVKIVGRRNIIKCKSNPYKTLNFFYIEWIRTGISEFLSA
jgi:hypothetical protein